MNYIVLDTETCGSIGSPLPYDIGWGVFDSEGNILKTRNYVVSEIFYGEKRKMATSYYANKLPQYYEDIKNKIRIVAKFSTIMSRLLEDREKFNVKVISAHNARFDKRALENASRYILKKDFTLPTITKIYDTLAMAKATIGATKKYKTFCIENNLLTPSGRIPYNAEVLYKYISGDLNFKEAHTGLADVMIEKDILVKCLKMHKSMPKKIIAEY